MPEADEATLIRLIGAGDHDAFDELYRRTSPWLTARLRRRCSDDEMVADVLQETFMAVWRAGRSFAGVADKASALSWLWGIAARRLIDAFRRRDHHAHPPVAAAPAAAASPAEEEAMTHEMSDVGDALRQLAPELREVLTAMVLDGLSVRDTAILLNIPEGTVKTRARRARLVMREVMA